MFKTTFVTLFIYILIVIFTILFTKKAQKRNRYIFKISGIIGALIYIVITISEQVRNYIVSLHDNKLIINTWQDYFSSANDNVNQQDIVKISDDLNNQLLNVNSSNFEFFLDLIIVVIICICILIVVRLLAIRIDNVSEMIATFIGAFVSLFILNFTTLLVYHLNSYYIIKKADNLTNTISDYVKNGNVDSSFASSISQITNVSEPNYEMYLQLLITTLTYSIVILIFSVAVSIFNNFFNKRSYRILISFGFIFVGLFNIILREVIINVFENNNVISILYLCSTIVISIIGFYYAYHTFIVEQNDYLQADDLVVKSYSSEEIDNDE